MSAGKHRKPVHIRSQLFNGIMILLLFVVTVASAFASHRSRKEAANIVVQIQRADYEGDRVALKTLYQQLAAFDRENELAARVRYWRGFALWRRAINGFNEKVDAPELQQDLRQAIEEFSKAIQEDAKSIDAKIGLLSCQGFLAYSIRQQDPGSPEVQSLLVTVRQLWKEATAAGPENPRLRWVLGPMVWNIPPEHGGGEAKAIEGYEKGLEAIRKTKTNNNDPLQPSWGEPELLMSLAWSNLNRTTPNLDVAEQDARSALTLVPYWHYVRDILMPQILEAKRKVDLNSTNVPAK